MTHGLAPMARRIPISLVRSRTVTSMILLTPTAPEISVPKPMSHISALNPTTRYWNALSVSSMFMVYMARLSSGAMV